MKNSISVGYLGIKKKVLGVEKVWKNCFGSWFFYLLEKYDLQPIFYSIKMLLP